MWRYCSGIPAPRWGTLQLVFTAECYLGNGSPAAPEEVTSVGDAAALCLSDSNHCACAYTPHCSAAFAFLLIVCFAGPELNPSLYGVLLLSILN